jgi:predicted XRE-type DNA-binding protein
MAQAHATRRAATLRHTRARQAPSAVASSDASSAGAVHCVANSDEHSDSPKYLLASQVNRLLDEHKLSQLAAAERLGISQPKVSAIRNYKLHGISLGRLMQALVALDQRVTIVVGPRTATPRESISVVL